MAWLSLRVSVPDDSEAGSVKIVVPKKVARLATRRNRLRRLLKEALRLEFRPAKDKEYVLRVSSDPGDIGLAEAKEALHAVWPR